MDEHHVFFIHPSLNRQLDQLHILALLNSVAINVEMQMTDILLLTSVGYIPSSRIAGSYGLLLVTWETAVLISQWLYIYIPINRFWGSLPHHFPVSTCYFPVWGNSHCIRCEVVSHCGFEWHCPGD